MRWAFLFVMLVGAVFMPRADGRKAEVEKTIKGEGVVGSQFQAVGGHTSTRVGPISAIGAALHYLIHPQTRKKVAAEAHVETERTSEPRRGPTMSGSPLDAGITGGLSLFFDNPNGRRRR
jgi:hypothetical protein